MVITECRLWLIASWAVCWTSLLCQTQIVQFRVRHRRCQHMHMSEHAAAGHQRMLLACRICTPTLSRHPVTKRDA